MVNEITNNSKVGSVGSSESAEQADKISGTPPSAVNTPSTYGYEEVSKSIPKDAPSQMPMAARLQVQGKAGIAGEPEAKADKPDKFHELIKALGKIGKIDWPAIRKHLR